ncbi:hypothetical protein QYE76_063148 [Lolium multiflorum]|uniref:Protein ALP1-like n=1 Tax=Lolium multiflorum TaxID=4521 RepID=A0AAD8S5U9_LOLMU|nr:hypothetical protein QYE76_063148 [Lolium multiflorum]
MIPVSLATLYAEGKSKMRCGSSAQVHRKAKARQRLEGYIMMYADHFPDEPLHPEACSPVFAKLTEGHALLVNYEVNGHHYTKGYYLADGIYPTLSTFVKTISSPKPPKEACFVKEREADVKRVFGILQQRFAVVPSYDLIVGSNVGGDELLCDIAQHDHRE